MPKFIVLFLIIVSLFFHVYNLNWGAPFYFHPDERNIASSVSQIILPTNLNPKFFAYGSLPIYTIYFSALFYNTISHCKFVLTNCPVSFEEALIITRIYSTLLSIFVIPLLYVVGKKLRNELTGLFAAFFATFSTGFIQFSHFGTFEMWLTFFSVLLFALTLSLFQKKSIRTILLCGICTGVLIAIKVSSLVLLPLPLLAFFLPFSSEKQKHSVVLIIQTCFVFFLAASITYIVTNPFLFLDFSSFRGSMHYESSVALGTLPVFYTGEFYQTIPVIFQFLHVYPFLLNPVLTILFVISFCYVIIRIGTVRSLPLFLLVLFYLFLFLSQAFLFVKWIRYMVPTLPFIYLVIAIFLSDSFHMLHKYYSRPTTILIKTTVTLCIIFFCLLWSLSYFITVFIEPDTRVAAAVWAKNHIPSQTPILSEVYDLGIVPFNAQFPFITLFNFYDIDNGELASAQLPEIVRQNPVIILPSQRIAKVRLTHKQKFPRGNAMYTALFNGTSGYIKIYETPCDIFCKITYLNNPEFAFEETANVFDRPTVFIFKKL